MHFLASCFARRWLLAATLAFLPPAAVGMGDEPSGLGRWSSGVPAPTKRTEVTAAALGGKIYLMGGFEEPSLKNIPGLTMSGKVEVYDPASDRWSDAAPLPIGLHHAGAAAIGDRLYVVGGFTRSFLSVWHPVADLHIYDPEKDVWTPGPPMPTARGGLAVTALDGKLYAIGGYGESGNEGAVEAYDPATREWSAKAPLATPRDHLAAAAAGGRIYAVAGRLKRDYGQNLAVTEVYDPDADRWTTGLPLPTPRSGIAAGAVGDTIYIVGGEAPAGTFRQNEAFDSRAGRWSTMAPMPTARHGLGSAVVDGRLYVLSGGPAPGGSFSDANEVFEPPTSRSVLRQAQDKPPQATGRRASAAQVGAVMAMLATFQDAGALPPESSPEANRLIKALIQFQAVFMKSQDPAVTRVLEEALTAKFGADAPDAADTLRRQGWSSQSLEAIVDHLTARPPWAADSFDRGLAPYHVGRQDFDLLANVFLTARRDLESRGRNLHEVYAARRLEMPGASKPR